MGTTFRRDLRAALHGVLVEFRVENPDLLRAAHKARPESIGEVPAAWVGEIAETVTHDSGTRQRQATATVTLVDAIAENAATEDRLDILADELLDRYTEAVRRIGTSIIEPVSIDPAEVEVNGAYYRALEIGFARTFIVEGRS